MKIVSVDHPEIPPHVMAARFRTEIVYFTTPPGERGAPVDLGPGEYWIAHEDALRWLDDLVVLIVSPLDASSKAEVGLSEEHEAWLEWLVQHRIQHVRVE